jgi:hypothetical protein
MHSEQINEIAAALAKAQGMMNNAKHDAKISMPNRKDYGYATLASVINAIKEPLSVNNIAYFQASEPTEAGRMLVTKLVHTSGQWIGSEYPLPMWPDKPQEMGKALTYARRYELIAITGISAEEDTDAEGVAEAVAKDKQDGAPVKMITDDQSSVISQALIECKGRVPEFLAMLGVPSISDIPANKYREAVGKLDIKLSAMGKRSVADIEKLLAEKRQHERDQQDEDFGS